MGEGILFIGFRANQAKRFKVDNRALGVSHVIKKYGGK
jgi:hypothetical protein